MNGGGGLRGIRKEELVFKLLEGDPRKAPTVDHKKLNF